MRSWGIYTPKGVWHPILTPFGVLNQATDVLMFMWSVWPSGYAHNKCMQRVLQEKP